MLGRSQLLSGMLTTCTLLALKSGRWSKGSESGRVPCLSCSLFVPSTLHLSHLSTRRRQQRRRHPQLSLSTSPSHVWKGAPTRSKGAAEFVTHPALRVADVHIATLYINLARQFLEQNWCTHPDGPTQSRQWRSHSAPNKAPRQRLSSHVPHCHPRTTSAKIVAKGKTSRAGMAHVRRKSSFLPPVFWGPTLNETHPFSRDCAADCRLFFSSVAAIIDDAQETGTGDGRGWHAPS